MKKIFFFATLMIVGRTTFTQLGELHIQNTVLADVQILF